MKSKPEKPASGPAGKKTKKPYARPVLRAYGTLRELVRLAKGGTNIDGQSGQVSKIGAG